MSKKNSKTPVSDVEAAVENALAQADTLTIKQAVVVSGLSEVYIRKALKAGKLVATKEPVTEGSKNLRNVITKDSFVAWRMTAGTKSKRDDGRNKYVVYMNDDEKTALEQMITGTEYGATLQRANVKHVATEEA